jgi:hypothetical protein
MRTESVRGRKCTTRGAHGSQEARGAGEEDKFKARVNEETRMEE